MERIFKKILATIIVITLLLINATQTLSYAATLLVSESRLRSDKTKYTYGNSIIYDFKVNGESGDYYCLRLGGKTQDGEQGYTKYSLNNYMKTVPTAANVNDFETKTGMTLKNNVEFYSRKTKSKVETMKALIWLIKNMYLRPISVETDTAKANTDKANQEKWMRSNITILMEKYCGNNYKPSKNSNININSLEPEEIRVIQQLVIWKFLGVSNNTRTTSKDYYNVGNNGVFSPNDLIKLTGFESSSTKRDIGYALYSALCSGAIANAITPNECTMKFNSDGWLDVDNGSSGKINIYNSTNNKYRIGPIKFSSLNLENFYAKLKVEGLSSSNTITESYIGDANDNKIININSNDTFTADIKDKINNKNIYVYLKTRSAIISTEEVKATLTYKYNYKPGLTDDYDIAIYYKKDTTSNNDNWRQPILKVKKRVSKGDGKTMSISATSSSAKIDLALTKQIDKIFRYDPSYTSNYGYNIVFDNTVNNSRPCIKKNGTYYMNKSPVTVAPGDIVRYKLTIYNEGSTDAVVKQVKDYLDSAGQEFLDASSLPASTSDKDYYHSNYMNRNRLSYVEDTNCVKIEYFSDPITIEAGKSYNIWIECKISSDLDKNSVGVKLWNVAAITEYGYMQGNQYINATRMGVDIDSTQNNIKEDNSNANYNQVFNKIGIRTSEYSTLNNIDKRLPAVNGDSSDYILEDDEDFEMVKIGGFDLALRKFITQINNEDVVDAVHPERFPYFIDNTIDVFNAGGTTAKYYHKKKPVKIKNGDIVTYKIRVYNEGYIPGYATKIVDYLPDGLEIANDQVNVDNGWTITSNGKKLETTILANTIIQPSYGANGFSKLIDRDSNTDENPGFFKDIVLKCRVNYTGDSKQAYLTNVAEIASSSYKKVTGFNANGTVNTTDVTNGDIDSTGSNVFTKNNVITDVDKYRLYQNQARIDKGYKNGIWYDADNLYTGVEDDDDFENLIIYNDFDLVLRKFIKGVNGDEADANGNEINRTPIINDDSLKALKGGSTAIYKHTKDPVVVKKDSVVNYILRIYNEGITSGTVKEIVDYIPAGMELAAGSEGWSYALENGQKVVVDGYTKIVYTGNKTVNSPGESGYEDLANKIKNNGVSGYDQISSEDAFWVDIPLNCRITSTVDGKILTNIAEITKYGYDNVEASQAGIDRDSQQNNVFSSEVTPAQYISNRSIGDGADEYTGEEDDDDFERVIISAKKDTEIRLKKVDKDTNAEINGAKFRVYKKELATSTPYIMFEGGYLDIGDPIPVDDEIEINGNGIIGSENNTIGTTQVYTFKETSSADGYYNDLEDYNIQVPVYFDENGDLQFGLWYMDMNWSPEVIANGPSNNKPFLITRDSQPKGSNVVKQTDSDFDIYDKIDAVIENNVLIITVKDTKVPDGEYTLQIRKKVDGNLTGGIKFNVTGISHLNDSTETQNIVIKPKAGGENGTLTTSSSSASTLGRAKTTPISITGEGYDEYTITEALTEADEFIGIDGNVKVYVTKELVDGNYVATDISFDENQRNVRTKTLPLQMNKGNVTASLSMSGTTLTVDLENAKKDGKYGLKIKKIGTNSSELLQGVTFDVRKDNDMDDIYEEADSYITDQDGIAVVASDEIINHNGDGEELSFHYLINESSVGANSQYKKYNEYINVYGWTTFNSTTGNYEVTHYSLSEDDKDLKENEFVKLALENGNTIIVRIKNEKIEGYYNLRLTKTSTVDSVPLQGVKFKVTKNQTEKFGYDDAELVTDENGKVQVGGAHKLTEANSSENTETPDEFVIDEVDLGTADNRSKYIKLADPVTVYVYGQRSGNKYILKEISFTKDLNSDQQEIVEDDDGTIKEVYKKVALTNGDIVTLYAYIGRLDGSKTAYVGIKNKPIEGSYYLNVKKIDAEDERGINGAKFEVNKVDADGKETKVSADEFTSGSSGNGITPNIKVKFNSQNADVIDTYKIYEVQGLARYVGIDENSPITIYVSKGLREDGTYGIKSASFSNESEVTEQTITLKDGTTVKSNGDSIKAQVRIVSSTVQVIVPNLEKEGKYSVELLKTKADGQIPLEGMSFTIKKGTTTIVENQTTGENGKISIGAKNIPINKNSVGEDEYEVTENTASNIYAKLKEPFKFYVTKQLNSDESAYEVKVSFTQNDPKDEDTKQVTLVNDKQVTIKAKVNSETGVVTITVPNDNLTGKYGFEILKTKEDGITPLEDETEDNDEVKFTVVKDNDSSVINNVKTQDGKITVINKDTPITSLGTEEYTITENSTLGNYIKLAEPIKVYVIKQVDNESLPTKYEAKVSFKENEIITQTEVNLEKANEKVTVKAEIGEDGVIKIIVPNKELTGKYSLEVLKTINDNGEVKQLNGVSFDAYRGESAEDSSKKIIDNKATGSEGNVAGKLNIINETIQTNNLAEPDAYTIKEVTSVKGYVPLAEPLTLYVFKGKNENSTEYIATGASFDKTNKNATSKVVKLKDGKEVSVVVNVNENGSVVTLTIPNEKIEGKYDIELIKIDQKDGVSTLEGVTFDIKVKQGNDEIKLYDIDGNEVKTTALVTDKDGKITLRNIKITEANNYSFEIKEIKVPTGYVILKDPVILNFNTKVDTTTQKYILDKISIAGIADVDSSRVSATNDTNKITVTVKNGQFDLALRKFITSVTTGVGTKDEKNIKIPNREPVFVLGENGKNIYQHAKDIVLLGNQNIVEYTIRVYNEGSISGYAKEIKDNIPEGLEFLPDNEINKAYGWKLLDEQGNEVKEVNKAKYIVTDYLSKAKETKTESKILNAFNLADYKAGKVKQPDYKDVKVAFKVNVTDIKSKDQASRDIINKAQISKDEDEFGNDVTDIDSTPDEWIDGEDDQDTEIVKPQYFDLSLVKYVTKAIIIENGQESVKESGYTPDSDGKQDIVKVDLKDSKINNVVVKFEYKIRITNEGEIAGYAKEISDYIPEGLRFDAADNPNWTEAEGKVITTQLDGKLLQPGENAEVSIILTWINRKDNLGLKQNVAEISKDYNIYGTPDIDSTPDNKVPGEDDIDDADVMLTVKTGQVITYVGLGIAVLAILGSGVVLIKKYVLK